MTARTEPAPAAGRDAVAASPFLTPAVAAERCRMGTKTLVRRLAAGALPGYRLGHRWLIPEAELAVRLSGAAATIVTPAEAVHELVGNLPAVLDLDDLGTFLGRRRAELYEILRIPVLRRGRAGDRVTTQALLAAALVEARNDCPPLRAAVR